MTWQEAVAAVELVVVVLAGLVMLAVAVVALAEHVEELRQARGRVARRLGDRSEGVPGGRWEVGGTAPSRPPGAARCRWGLSALVARTVRRSEPP